MFEIMIALVLFDLVFNFSFSMYYLDIIVLNWEFILK